MEPIKDKAELVAALHDAAELEHQLMCVYLYAILSLKKNPEPPSLRPAELEAVRRWASQMYMVARQEMEHLSFVNSILTAIGEMPWFACENIPKGGLLSPYFDLRATAKVHDPSPRDFPFVLAPFAKETIQSFICAESPSWKDIPPHTDPKPEWCFCVAPPATHDDGAVSAFRSPAPVPTLRAADLAPKPGRSHLRALHQSRPAPALALPDMHEFHAGLIQELYLRIRAYLVEHPELFSKAQASKQVEIPVEYNIYVFPVTDWSSAARAIDQILREGEGLQRSPGTLSHFDRYTSVYKGFLELDREGFEPARRLMVNPEPNDIPDAYTRFCFETFNDGYCTLLLMLDALYAHYVPEQAEKYPHFSTALAQTTFAPAMTMLIRSLGEILVQLPTGNPEKPWTGPSFYIDEETRLLLEAGRGAGEKGKGAGHLDDITFFLVRWDRLAKKTCELAKNAPERLASAITFLDENTQRIAANVRQIYQQGTFSMFVVSEPQGGS